MARAQDAGHGATATLLQARDWQRNEALDALVMQLDRSAQRLPEEQLLDDETWRQFVEGRIELLAGGRIASAMAEAPLDVLERLPESPNDGLGVRVYLVIPGRSVGEADWDRAAFRRQLLASIEGVGRVSVSVATVDPAYQSRAPGASLGAKGRLLRIRDVSAEVEPLALEVSDRLARARAVASGALPEVAMGVHCRRPERCPYLSRCERALARDAVFFLPRLDASVSHDYLSRGIERIGDIPARELRSPLQRRAQRAHSLGGLALEPTLASLLDSLRVPCSYLDFEYLAPAVPRFSGMRSLEAVPYQWSLHRADRDGSTSHYEFLAEDLASDPRPSFIESLLAATRAADEPICVYSSAEADVLSSLARAFPEHLSGLEGIRRRLVDLQAILIHHVYHPDFRGEFGLKRVSEALGLDARYDDLPLVANGADAALALVELARPGCEGAARQELRAALSRYCRRDTQALVELHRYLRKAAEATRSSA